MPIKRREAGPAERRKLPELSGRLLDGPNPPNTPLGGLKVLGVLVPGVEFVPAELEKEKFAHRSTKILLGNAKQHQDII